jgi:Formate hydrogenlyase subunit 4
VKTWLIVIAYIVLAPVIGGLIAGIDRKISAHMQKRVGPSILQPFYDVHKLFSKQSIVVNKSQKFYVLGFFTFIIFTGCLFFAGGDLLLVIFVLTLASIFLVMGAYSTNSPYSYLGAERELIQMMAYEPMVILTTVGLYMVTHSFFVRNIAAFGKPIISVLPGVFLGYVFILTIKLRKSPFDLSMSHHAHQELVRGLITEFSGPELAWIEVAHWYENVFLLGLVYLFLGSNPIAAIIMVLVVYFLEIFIDNNSARLKWQHTLLASWVIALILGAGNIAVLMLF